MSIFTIDRTNLAVEAQDFIDEQEARNAPPVNELAPKQVRENLIAAQTEIPVILPDADIIDAVWDIGPTGKVDVRIVRPKGSRDGIPAMLYLHGGGWVAGGKETHDRLIRQLAVESGVAVVFPNYLPAPEYHYPVQLEQCYAVLEYMGLNAEVLGFEPDGFVVAGDSAGGNMATVLAMLSRERGGPKILYQLLFYPVTDAYMDTKSYRDFADGPWLTRDAMAWYWKSYIPDTERREERNASPLLAGQADLELMPPTLIIVAENDVLRDEGEEYARRLDDAGVDVACVRVNGMFHDFVMLNAVANAAPTRAAINMAVSGVKKAFQELFPEASLQ